MYDVTGTYTITVEAESSAGDMISDMKEIDITVAPKSWQLVWADEFNTTTINSDNWKFELGNNGGWGNAELQYYTEENASVKMDGENGFLEIVAKKESKGGFQYTSSRMITKDKQEFLFGRVEIRAKLPKGQGIWPALWMLGANIDEVPWPGCGEIDIMEMIGGGAQRDNRVHGTAHWYNDTAPVGKANYGGHVDLSSGIFADAYHVFSIEWNKNFIIWFLDGVEFHRIDITPPDSPSRFDEFRKSQFLIFNIAVGGNWPGAPNNDTVFPQTMSVDYVRVYQYK
ncbi:glycoside hydrolase family 16 protein [Pseudochryseolinea flava]|uniref:Glycoside hydrolase family 16 protein n=2 Tax=Pseudochryseolinea flava TaxID=2059302 RepID=A0A364Y4U0_9BACT|nr:glycoside hydrolase family 16 protein [Pseudochryseolinea flava]